ncbi:MAG: Gfo/Idh/MocA family oxidoreductase [Bryobacterales bacterium]|nr:Gfo/Idh/MocA family oxidoreductase [Bryobacterales bacterium]
MKWLVVGGGSMGRRRLRDLTYLNAGEILLFEPAPGRCREVAEAFEIRGFDNFEAALGESPGAIVVSAPPTLHEAYVRAAMERGLHVFAEVPFVYDLRVAREIAAGAGPYPGVLGVSHTIRYYPPYRIIHDLLADGAIGKPLYIECSLGNYLPDWHPYEDYRKFYGGDVRMGGAGMDMIFHDMAPLLWWMGPVASVLARFSKLSQLEVHGPDNQDVLLGFATGARGYFHNDIIERGTLGRHVRIAGETGSIEWRQDQTSLRLFEGGANAARQVSFSEAADWEQALAASREMSGILSRQRVRSGHIPSDGGAAFTYESCYLREMREFVRAVQGSHAYPVAFPHELETVSVFHAIWQSNEETREIHL